MSTYFSTNSRLLKISTQNQTWTHLENEHALTKSRALESQARTNLFELLLMTELLESIVEVM
jgi:hypothetical protein